MGSTAGETRLLKNFSRQGSHQHPDPIRAKSKLFVLFDSEKQEIPPIKPAATNFPEHKTILTLDGPWKLNFNANAGGPGEILFDKLEGGPNGRNRDQILFRNCLLSKPFTLTKSMFAQATPLWINLGEVFNLAEVSLNGIDLGTLWTAPWSTEITKQSKKAKIY